MVLIVFNLQKWSRGVFSRIFGEKNFLDTYFPKNAEKAKMAKMAKMAHMAIYRQNVNF